MTTGYDAAEEMLLNECETHEAYLAGQWQLVVTVHDAALLLARAIEGEGLAE